MMKLLLASVAVGCIGFARGFVLDQSCQAAPNHDILISSLESAFDMASTAATSLSADPVLADPQRMYDYLFIPEAKPRVLSVLQGVDGFRIESADKTRPEQVVIYCDLSRYVKRDDGLMYDPDIDQAESEASLTAECGTPVSGSALAYTVGQRDQDKVQQIQICPWYMNLVASVEYKVVATNTLKGWVMRMYTAVQMWFGSLTTMDALALFDLTLLHELTHTRDAGATNDVSGGKDSYGWTNCVGLKEKGGFNNADSIAFFALTLKVLAQGGLPQQDGSVQLAGGNAKKRRSTLRGRVWRA